MAPHPGSWPLQAPILQPGVISVCVYVCVCVCARACACVHACVCACMHVLNCILQVCIPFLMLCMGLDPKLDIGQLSSVIGGCGIGSSPLPREPAKEGALQDAQLSSGQVNGDSGRGGGGRVLSALLSGSGSGQLSGATPTLKMLMTGCQAIMLFTGNNSETLPDSLIQSGKDHVTVM